MGSGDIEREALSVYGGSNQVVETGYEWDSGTTPFFYAAFSTIYGFFKYPEGSIPGNIARAQFNLYYSGSGAWLTGITYWDSYGSLYQVQGLNTGNIGVYGGAITEAGTIFVGNINDGSSMGVLAVPSMTIYTTDVGAQTAWTGYIIDANCTSPSQVHCLNGAWAPYPTGWNSSLVG